MITVNIPVFDIMIFVFGFMAGYLVYVVCDCINEWRFKQDKTILEKMDTIEKIRTEVESINPWTLAYAPSKDRDIRPQIVSNVKNHVLEIIDKYKVK